jgi:hypothetical protein
MGKAVQSFAAGVLVATGIVLTGGGAALALIGGTVAAGVTASMPSAPSGAGKDPTDFSYTTDAGLPIPYGRVSCAGDVNYRVAYDATNRYQSLFCTLAASGPIKSIVSFAADDELTSFDPTLNKATNGEHNGFMWLQTKLGTQPQTALTSPTGTGAGIPAPGWTADHKASGRAVYCLTMFENSKGNEYPAGIVNPRFIIEGVYGWDPRLDSTWPGGSGSCRIDDPSTWVWIDNPALAALDWCIGRWEGLSATYSPDRYGVPYDCSLVAGIGSSLDGIDVSAFIAAANVADANGWTVAALPTSRDDKYEVLTKLLAACGAEPARKAGKISCVIHTEEVASILTVTGADTNGPVRLSLGQSRLDRRNTVIPTCLLESANWEQTAIRAVSDAAWVTADGGERGTGLDLPYVPNEDQAAQLGYYHLANRREAIHGTVPFRAHMRRIEPGDCFTFNEAGFFLDGLKVRCLKRAYDPMTGGVEITFRQETDAKHAAALAQTGEAPPAVSPGAPPPPFVEPPTDFATAISGADVDLTWRNPATLSHNFIDVYRNTGSTDFGTATLIDTVVGAPSDLMLFTDAAPGVGTHNYWLVAVDLSLNEADEVGPEAETI